MSHDKRQLARIGSCPYGTLLASTLFYCATTDSAAEVLASDYFNPSVDQLVENDTIIVKAGIGGTPETLILNVDSNTGTAVTVSAETGASGD